jgi:hypothetical protein
VLLLFVVGSTVARMDLNFQKLSSTTMMLTCRSIPMSSASCLPLIQLGTIAVFADTEFEIFLKSSALLELGFAVPVIVHYDIRAFERKRERASMNARTLLRSFYMCCIGWEKKFILGWVS